MYEESLSVCVITIIYIIKETMHKLKGNHKCILMKKFLDMWKHIPRWEKNLSY